MNSYVKNKKNCNLQVQYGIMSVEGRNKALRDFAPDGIIIWILGRWYYAGI